VLVLELAVLEDMRAASWFSDGIRVDPGREAVALDVADADGASFVEGGGLVDIVGRLRAIKAMQSQGTEGV
jgi:hypothetical protein